MTNQNTVAETDKDQIVKPTLEPMGDRLIIKLLEIEDNQKRLIEIPETAKQKPHTGKVMAVGAGRYEQGKLIPCEIKSGDIVLFSKYSGTEVTLGNENYLVIREADIMARINIGKILPEEKICD